MESDTTEHHSGNAVFRMNHFIEEFQGRAIRKDRLKDQSAPDLAAFTDRELVELISRFAPYGGSPIQGAGQAAVRSEIDLRCSRRAEEQAEGLVGATRAFQQAMERAAESAAARGRGLSALERRAVITSAVLGAAAGAAFGVIASLLLAYFKG